MSLLQGEKYDNGKKKKEEGYRVFGVSNYVMYPIGLTAELFIT
jgi:hypothetical protein